MRDPLRSIIFRERARKAVCLGLLLLFALVAGVSLFWPPTYVTNGQLLEATVVRVGSYPAGKALGGELPILTIRLPNGSIRQVRASWSTAGECMPGSRVPIVQHGIALQVGLSGCEKPTRLPN